MYIVGLDCYYSAGRVEQSFVHATLPSLPFLYSEASEPIGRLVQSRSTYLPSYAIWVTITQSGLACDFKTALRPKLQSITFYSPLCSSSNHLNP